MRSKRLCKEYRCNSPVAVGKGLIARTARRLGLCRYCYNGKFPPREPSNLPPCRQGAQRLLSFHELRYMESRTFEGMEQVYWSKDFLREWQDYIKARFSGA